MRVRSASSVVRRVEPLLWTGFGGDPARLAEVVGGRVGKLVGSVQPMQVLGTHMPELIVITVLACSGLFATAR